MDKLLPAIAWIVVALQVAGYARVYLTSRHEHSHVPEAFIELHILAVLGVALAIGSIWGDRFAPSPGWWVVRGLAALSLVLLAWGHLRDRVG